VVPFSFGVFSFGQAKENEQWRVKTPKSGETTEF